jgi:hypothetical protein
MAPSMSATISRFSRAAGNPEHGALDQGLDAQALENQPDQSVGGRGATSRTRSSPPVIAATATNDSDLDVVRTARDGGPRGAPRTTVDLEHVAADPRDARAHRVQGVAEPLHMPAPRRR